MADLRDIIETNEGAAAEKEQAAGTKGDKVVRVDAQNFTVEVQKRFKEGWEKAGGYVGDLHSESPLFAPWSRDECIDVRGEDPEVWGADYWQYRKEELANAVLMEAFDAQGKTIAEALVASAVMTKKPGQYFFEKLHDVVTPAFEADVMVEPLAVFAQEVHALTPVQLANVKADDLSTYADRTGVHLDTATVYLFSDGSYLLRDRADYVALTDEEGHHLIAKMGEL